MKPVKSICLIALLITTAFQLSSCLGDHEPEEIGYNLFFNFIDSSGNDFIVKNTPLNDGSIYELDIIISAPCNNWNNDIYNFSGSDVNQPVFRSTWIDGHAYFTSYFYLPADDCPEMKTLTYKLKYPGLFGDEEVHEIVSYWEIPKKKQEPACSYAICKRIEFEGKEISSIAPVETKGYATHSLVTIVLDENGIQ
ncbi:hypothetical protein M2480_002089 [Parabacteroides sp. PFB2-12]|uniref:hypothetical protein n=1 Tax=unclassified Parabacteroides TaxID=2649774 RepID=UPI002473C334|nr:MULTISPECIES: hypothetical protein [unclassified Parabacteroides]MDH6342217.1 hypothetical protein [Parabacteroides sp. PM6-13]MDH6391099.1 hypothetical protein [Parabacteroides sp. PFB2-12]